jgi:E3 ubiquitin-protein ligase HUWE1
LFPSKSWPFTKVDLYHFIPLLDRLDEQLESVIELHGFSADCTIQSIPFDPQTKQLVLCIVRFSRLLLENATNRSLYSSQDASVVWCFISSCFMIPC